MEFASATFSNNPDFGQNAQPLQRNTLAILDFVPANPGSSYFCAWPWPVPTPKTGRCYGIKCS
jgi:hypothetical protein